MMEWCRQIKLVSFQCAFSFRRCKVEEEKKPMQKNRQLCSSYQISLLLLIEADDDGCYGQNKLRIRTRQQFTDNSTIVFFSK
jgi:hypothetical protein